jgi:hypothetical protein
MDADLRSIQEARDLVAGAAMAQRSFGNATQDEVDRVVVAMAGAASRAAESLARPRWRRPPWGSTHNHQESLA